MSQAPALQRPPRRSSVARMPEMFDLANLSARIAANPPLQSIAFDRLLLFLSTAAAIKNDITLIQPSDHPFTTAPDILPRSAQCFLADTCGLSIDTVVHCWSTFKDVAWHCNETHSLLQAPTSTFHEHGISYGFTARTLYPPAQHCPAPSCPRTLKGLRMMHAEQRQCVLYTLSNGPLPIYSVHLSCEACELNYHHNFRVFKGERTYYGGIPDIIQVGEHQFVEKPVIEIWLALMDQCNSATACAYIYNTSMSQSNQPPPGWQFGFSLSADHIWSAFLLYCLLEDALDREEYLVVPHTGDHKDRLNDLVRARNQRMRIAGQPELTHFCDKCTRWYLDDDGNVERKCSVVVTDGICIGHPCCSRHNCHIPLSNGKDRFCPTHTLFNNICSIVDCGNEVVHGNLTCTNPEHQEIERLHREKGKSRFQLQDRLERARATHRPTGSTSNSQILSKLAASDNNAEEFTVDPKGRITADNPDDAPAQDPITTNSRKVRAKFTRSRTHNEQLVVAPCGMILGRDTMFGAEGIASVAEFIKRIFRIEALKPDHLFYDNNCSLAKHVQNDPYFAKIGLSVDVFHFKSKHKETDTFCQENCNPAAFLELKTKDDGWFFNSSAAEQANAWMGGYLAICREMLVDKYDFFLDQMILRHNQATKTKLEAQGCRPGNWSL